MKIKQNYKIKGVSVGEVSRRVAKTEIQLSDLLHRSEVDKGSQIHRLG